MNLYIKEMSKEDVPFIFHVYEQNRAALHGRYTSLIEWTEYFKDLNIKGNEFPYESHHIVMVDNSPAVWLKISDWNKAEIYISMLVVDDKFKHKGISKFAIQYAEKSARYWTKSAIRIIITTDNFIAKECFLKCGYELSCKANYKTSDGIDREGCEFMKNIFPEALTEKNLIKVLSKMFNAKIAKVDFLTTQLQGGTVGDIRFIKGTAEFADGSKQPYNIVLKVQKKWERYGDPNSWRREYDLYKSDLCKYFSDSLNWPKCYHAEMNEEENEIQIWMEYIEGVSGLELSGEMYEQAAKELGRFQGKLYAEQPEFLKNLTNLSNVDYMKNFYLHYKSWNVVYDYIRSDDCEIPKHLCKMIIDIDENADEIFNRVEKLPVVLCHRDFWVTNIIYSDGKIRLIDWDTAGWGYFGEDLASLIADEADVENMVEYYQKCTEAYYKGFSEYSNLSHITDNCVYELILLMFGYRQVECYKFAESTENKMLHLNILQKIYEMKNI